MERSKCSPVACSELQPAFGILNALWDKTAQGHPQLVCGKCVIAGSAIRLTDDVDVPMNRMEVDFIPTVQRVLR